MIRFEPGPRHTPSGEDRRPPTVYHAIDPAVGLEFLIDLFNDGLPMRLQTRPIGADGWEQWSPPVELEEVREGL